MNGTINGVWFLKFNGAAIIMRQVTDEKCRRTKGTKRNLLSASCDDQGRSKYVGENEFCLLFLLFMVSWEFIYMWHYFLSSINASAFCLPPPLLCSLLPSSLLLASSSREKRTKYSTSFYLSTLIRRRARSSAAYI